MKATQSSVSGPPARLAAAATLALPRPALFALCVIYIFAGLLGRDIWKTEDATTFGVMWTMAQGSLTDWLLPNVAGAPVIDNGPLMYWCGALLILLLGPVFDAPLAARLATVAWFGVLAAAIWYATYLLGRRPAAQPLALAFGGQPEPRDYGRALADGALLILLSTLGLLTRMHESSSDVALIALMAACLYGMVVSLERPSRGALWLALAITGLGLTRGPELAGVMLLTWIALLTFEPMLRPARRATVMIALPIILVGLAIWPMAALLWAEGATDHFQARMAYRAALLTGMTPTVLMAHLKTMPWFAWLAWPLALWSLWSWRRHLRAAHILLPCTLILVAAALMLISRESSPAMGLVLLPGMVVLAAFGLPTLKRGAASGIDWFSVMIFSGAGLLIWLGWVAMMTGYPPKIANNFARQTPGFTPGVVWAAVGIACIATIAWIAVVRWRLYNHPRTLWRSVVLSSAGLTLSWVLLMSLWLAPIDYSKTYRHIALDIARQMPGGGCVRTDNLGLAQRASFAWFAGLRFAPVGYMRDPEMHQRPCPFLLRQDDLRQPRTQEIPGGGNGWELLWEGNRAGDRRERFRLYRRASTTSATAIG